ncbi:unnamed protein product [Rhizophagus irregularis]|nr:unnamed protein product [Rhizophagus irregularis]
MLNNILERAPKLVLDRLHYRDPSTQVMTFTNDPITIERECIKHFQLLGQAKSDIDNIPTYRNITDLPSSWQLIYNPINTKDSHHMINTITLITSL